MKPNAKEKSQGSKMARRLVPERRYRKPPVIESLCEIYFSDSSWDDTVPGAFYERIKTDYPKKQQKRIQEAQITMGPEQAAASVRQLPPWMQFISDEKHRMVQIAQDLLVVNQLHPYPHFEEWEPEIYRALRIYQEIADPKRMARLGLRYINRVVVPEEQVRMEEYFTVYPNLPGDLSDAHGSFLVRVEVPQADQGHTVLITFGTAPLDPNERGQAFLLDLYDTVDLDAPVQETTLKEQVGQAHENIVMVFENSITDRLRDLFEEEKAS